MTNPFSDLCACGSETCVNCGLCLCEECCTTRHVILVYFDPTPHDEGERIYFPVCNECRPIVEAEVQRFASHA